MPLPSPKLDDRTFDQLVADAVARVKTTSREWNDLSVGDPGLALIDVFAFLTENMLYRLNRVPAKVYIALLNLVGVRLRPPSAATVRLTFSRATGHANDDIEIPSGTQVGTSDGTVVFRLSEGCTLKAGDKSVELSALHCEVVDGELVGTGSGGLGQALRVRNGPIIAPTGDPLDVVVGVELEAGQPIEGLRTRHHVGKVFELWQLVDTFADVEPGARAFAADRASGLIVFAPAGEVPAFGREIRAWYRRGGGITGNVAPETLTVVKAPALKLSVTNLARAVGGSAAETVEEAVRRAPLELSSMHTAVTARDFERVAEDSGGVHARALTLAQAWRHADPGTVQILVLPVFDVDPARDGAVTAQDIVARRSDDLRGRVQKLVDARRPLGVRVQVDWMRVRPVSVSARVIVTQGEEHDALRARICQRLNRLLSPFRDRATSRSLRASDGYDAITGTPGVRYAENLRFRIAQAPDTGVADLVRDPHQPRAWFATGAKALYRTLDDGDSWSIVFEAEGGTPRFARRHSDKPGLLVVATAGSEGHALHLSKDCGETWKKAIVVFKSEVTDAAWSMRNGRPLLFVATKDGLVQFQPDAGTGPASVVVDNAIDARGYYAVATCNTTSGVAVVAVSAREKGDVYLSEAGGAFRPTGLKDEDIRTLAVQRFNARDFLWAGAQAEAGEPGDGAYRLELRPNGEFDPGTWTRYNIGWNGGSCQALAFVDGIAFAASNRAGVVKMDTAVEEPSWQETRVDAGLPIRDRQRLREVTAAVAAALGTRAPIVMAGTPVGVFKSVDGGERYARASQTEFADRVPLPPNWVYCADEHELTLVSEDDEG